jgi:hypothetical protein
MLRHRLAVPLLVLAAAVAIPLARSPARAATTAVVDQRPACGTERWPVKVFEDPDAGLVDMSQAVPESVADLVRVPPPANLPADRRLSPVELTLYSVTARLVEAKREEDSDFHVVIADPDTNDTMIVELPDAARCAPGASGDHVAEMQAARNAFIARFGTPSSDRFVPLSGTAQIIGLGFFDFLHGQTGVAPNAIELHPVLWFTVTSSSTPVTGTITPLAPTPEGEIPSAAEVTIVSVEGGIVGGPATLSAQAPPGASCSISYTTPAGTQSTAAGLVLKAADSSGQVSWAWTIGSSTRPGTGGVTVTCSPGGAATATIAIR